MFLIAVAVFAFYFYRKAQNASVYDALDSDELFKRLWSLPIMQVIIGLILIGFAYLAVEMCMQNSQSQYVAPALEENFGFFGTIGANIINENISSEMSPFISELDKLHGWTQYLFYASVLTLGIQIYALKEQKMPCDLVITMTLVVSCISILLIYKIAYVLDLGMGTYLKNETFGLLQANEATAVVQGFTASCLLGLVLIVLHFNHYNIIKRYYNEDVVNLNPMARFVKQTDLDANRQITTQESKVDENLNAIRMAQTQAVQTQVDKSNYIPCPVCGENILSVAQKCKHCGEWVNKEPKEMIRCSVCGEKVEKGKENCPVCHETLCASHLLLDAEETVKECIVCGEKILEFAQKCKHCGEWQNEMTPTKNYIQCPICGEDIEEGCDICPHCNESI